MKRRVSFILILICTVNAVFCQSPEVVVETGHSASITDIEISSDGLYLISSGNDQNIIVWDRLKQKQFRVLKGHKAPVTSLVMNPNSEFGVFSTSLDGTVLLWNFVTGEKEVVLEGLPPITGMKYLHQSNKYALSTNMMSIYSIEFKLLDRIAINLKQFEDEEFFNSSIVDFDFSFNEKLCVATDGNGVAVIMDLEKRSNNRQLQSQPINKLKFLPNSKRIAQVFSTGVIRYSDPYSISSIRSFKSFDWGHKNGIALDAHSVYVTTEEGELLILDNKHPIIKDKVKILDSKIAVLKIDTIQNVLVAASESGIIKVLNLDDFSEKEEYKGKINRVIDIDFSSDSKILFAAFQNGELRLFNFETLESLTFGGLISNQKNKEVEVVDVEFRNQELWVIYLKKKRSSEMKTRFDNVKTFSAKWNLLSNTLEEVSASSDKYYESLYKRGRLVNGVILDANNEPVYLKNLMITEGEFYFDSTKNELNRNGDLFSVIHDDRVSAYQLNEKGDFLASASWDGSIRFWDVNSGKLLNKLYLFDENQFTLFNDENVYFSSKSGIKNIGFRLKNKLYSFEQFDLIYNRPDIVFKNLNGLLDSTILQSYYLAFKKRLDRLGLSEEDLSVDQEIPEFKMNVLELPGNKMKLDFTWKVEGADRVKLNIYLNGVPEGGTNGLELFSSTGDTSIVVQFENGLNRIETFVSNGQGVKSLRENLIVNIEGEKQIKKSDLYVVTVGCSEYKQSEYNLNYAAKDAQDVNAFFTKSESIYNVKTMNILNEKVTKNILVDIEKFLSNATFRDVVIVYVAGHGVLSKDLNFFLASHDIDFLSPEKRGISYESIESLLENCKSRHKSLFLDACHSGELDKDEAMFSNSAPMVEEGEVVFRAVGKSVNQNGQNTFQLSKSLFADMQPNHGINIISSAGGAEYAMEGSSWNNGVFTYAFLNGLRSKDGDLNLDGEISLSEIKKYVLDKVVELTNGNQNPTSRIENIYNDFTLIK